ncbi:MAG: ribosome maturation factor RimP [Alphaproteobacteria bacterium]
MASLESRIQPMALAAAAAFGLVLVCARLTGGGKFQTLQVLLEKPDGSSPVLDDCTAVSKQLARDLDQYELTHGALIKGRYTLEVSSPGLDRPLITPADYQRFVGRTAALRFNQMQSSGYTTFQAATGVIKGADSTTVTLQLEQAETPQSFPLSHIFTAKLAPTKAEMDAWMRDAIRKSPSTDEPK